MLGKFFSGFINILLTGTFVLLLGVISKYSTNSMRVLDLRKCKNPVVRSTSYGNSYLFLQTRRQKQF